MELIVPTLGESITEATVSKWLKKVGDSFEADEPLVEIETDKITVEVPAPSAGSISEIKVEEGADVNIGGVLALLGDKKSTNGSVAPEKVETKKPSKEEPKMDMKGMPPEEMEEDGEPRFAGIDTEEGRAEADTRPEQRTMGFKTDKGGNMSVDEKDDFWKTQEGYDKAIEMYGQKPAWVKEPTLVWNAEEQKYDAIQNKDEFEDLSRSAISSDLKALFG